MTTAPVENVDGVEIGDIVEMTFKSGGIIRAKVVEVGTVHWWAESEGARYQVNSRTGIVLKL